MKLLLAFALSSLVGSGIALATPVQIGGTSIEIPTPRGFARVVPEMSQVSELQKHFVPPTNDQLAAFIVESDVPQALAGEIPLLQRRFTVQIAKSLINRPVTRAEFAQLKKKLASDNEQAFQKLKEQLPDLMSKASKGMSGQFDTELVIEIGGVVPFPPHHEDEHSISSSMISRNEFTSSTGESFIDVIAATMTLLRVRDHVIFIYAYGGKDDLDWTRERSKEWVAEIVSANESRSSSLSPSRSRSSGMIDWDKVGAKAVGGAFLGLVVGLISWLVARRKQS